MKSDFHRVRLRKKTTLFVFLQTEWSSTLFYPHRKLFFDSSGRGCLCLSTITGCHYSIRRKTENTVWNTHHSSNTWTLFKQNKSQGAQQASSHASHGHPSHSYAEESLVLGTFVPILCFKKVAFAYLEDSLNLGKAISLEIGGKVFTLSSNQN